MADSDNRSGLLLGGNQDFSTEFYLNQFKITPCTATYPHNWSSCPFVHPNEKARRRDPRIYSYNPVPCPDDRKGVNCPRKDSCQFSHNVYEYWLHPKRFRTQLCHLGTACTRPICFFAHRVGEIRHPDREDNGAMPPLGTAAQQQQQPFVQQAVAGPQAAGAAVRPAVGQPVEAAVLQQQVQQGQQQAQHQAQQAQQQVQQMAMQLQQLNLAAIPPAPPLPANNASAYMQQQPYPVGAQFPAQVAGLSGGTPSHGSNSGMPQGVLDISGPLAGDAAPLAMNPGAYAVTGPSNLANPGYVAMQGPQQQPQQQQQYPMVAYAPQYGQQLQQYPPPPYQQ